MQSFGIWYKKRNKAIDDEKLILHANLWKLPKKGKYRIGTINHAFLDLGFKLMNYKNVEYIKIAIPHLIEFNEICCLYDTVNKGELLRSIFNRKISKSGVEGQNFIEVTETDSAGGVQKFNFIKLTSDNYEIKQEGEYSILKIFVKDEILKLDSTQLYFRFRLLSNSISNLSKTFKPKNSILVSSFYKTEITEFLFNRKRNLPANLMARSEDEFKIEMINFFMFIEGDQDLIQSHKPLNSLRKLETNIWTEYLPPSKYMLKNIFAYQWNDDAKDNNFNALIKFRKENSNLKTIIVFLLLFFTLSIIAKLLNQLILPSLDK